MMKLRKLMGLTLLLIAVGLSACNLSQMGAAGEVALNPPTVENRPTRTPISFNNPTSTPQAAPTITILSATGNQGAAAQSGSQAVDVAVIATQPPPQGICSVKPSGSSAVNVRLGPDTNFGVTAVLRAGTYAPVLSRASVGWYRVDLGINGQGWVSPKVVTLYGPCSSLPVDDVSAGGQSLLSAEPSLTPTPTGLFGFTMNIPLNHLITKVDVGSIPAGTTVMVMTSMFTGSEYRYDIMTADGRYETARESQLAYSAVGGTQPFPTPTPYVFIATATIQYTPGATPQAYYQSELGMGVYRVMTTQTVAGIAAGTPVRLSSATYLNGAWMYDIVTKDERYATAGEYQLTYIPNAGGGGPTPTVPVMDLPTDTSPSDVVIPDGMCTITANSATNLVAQPGSSTVVGVLNPGPWAQVGATNGQGWYKVTIWTDGRQGWTNTATVTLHGPCAALPVEQ